jgi:hypothetical protein
MKWARVDFVIGMAIVVATVLSLTLPAKGLLPDQYTALATGIQALVVVVALFVAVLTLRSESRNRRVDRVHELHRELTTGEVGEARARLGAFLRSNGTQSDPVRITTLDELRKGPLNSYPSNQEEQFAKPRRDATLILRFFERARIAQTGQTVDDTMFAALIGHYAGWWALAIPDSGTTSRRPLTALADWANEYAAKHPKADGLTQWATSRKRDFPSKFALQVPVPAPPPPVQQLPPPTP